MKRTSKHYLILAALTSIVVCIGCGKKEKEEPRESSTPSNPQSTPANNESTTPAPTSAPTATPPQSSAPTATSPGSSFVAPSGPSDKDMAEIAAKNAETLKAMNQGKDIEPVSTGTLKDFLPATLAGMKQGETDVRQMGMMGIKAAAAQADYEAGDATLELMIMDLGNVSGPMRMGIAGWTMAQIDRQTDTGYEKTVTYQGYKGMEEYDRQTKHGEFRIFVGDRFVVEITGDNATMETIKKAMGEIDLKKLIEAAK